MKLEMPSYNPKHKKSQSTSPEKMGIKRKAETCLVGACGKAAEHHVAFANVSEYAQKLNWTIDRDKKTRRAALCKKHYREFKKLKKKDEKYQRMRDYGPPK